jgi:HEAT repeat protein
MQDSYSFRPEDLRRGDEHVHRLAIIHISREGLSDYETRLAEMMATEPSYANRRHIVRALGRIGSSRSVGVLLETLAEPEGLILGDAAEALGRLKAADAVSRLQELTVSRLDWVAAKARWALREIQD